MRRSTQDDEYEFASLYPRLYATPSPLIVPIAEQCAARGFPVPVGQSADVIRAQGLAVNPLLPGDAVLDVIGPDKEVDESDVGRRTGYAFCGATRFTTLDHILNNPEMVRQATPAQIESVYIELATTLVALIQSGIVPVKARTLLTAMESLSAEAMRREHDLQEHAPDEVASTRLEDVKDSRLFGVLCGVACRAEVTVTPERARDGFVVVVQLHAEDLPVWIAREAIDPSDLRDEAHHPAKRLNSFHIEEAFARDGYHTDGAILRIAERLILSARKRAKKRPRATNATSG